MNHQHRVIRHLPEALNDPPTMGQRSAWVKGGYACCVKCIIPVTVEIGQSEFDKGICLQNESLWKNNRTEEK